MRTLSSILLAFLLVACGGGEETQERETLVSPITITPKACEATTNNVKGVFFIQVEEPTAKTIWATFGPFESKDQAVLCTGAISAVKIDTTRYNVVGTFVN
jgi:hypothetical protein